MITRTRPLTRQLDLNLLELFDVVWRTRNLTAAGEQLGLSQPAVSHGLAKLRRAYGDALFVRLQRGVEPTPFASAIAPTVAEALRVVRGTLDKPSFDPAVAQRHFRIAMSDIGERFFMPTLWPRLAREAPGVSCECLSPGLAELQQGLASGEIDLAVGFIPGLGAQVLHQALFSEQFVYLARKGHPQLGHGRSTSALLRTPHVLASHPGTRHLMALERVLMSQAVRAPIALRVRSFLSIGPIVAETDLVSPVPNNLAGLIADHLNLRLIPPPIELPLFDVRLYWHRRSGDEPALRWIREVMVEMFGG
ncbi:LysR family transcriptional regulator [Ottowia thiooxydans]|uniref:LysR family transcriptional regulator n=1 Tax=Ottowia thiooxydans TaxID=219182 RepID=UPI0004128764|nr:LysR family transcriptional regulator [Ottowia thiooxydans]